MEKLIDIEHVTAAYGNKTVLRDISLTVWKGDFFGYYRTERRREDDLAEGYTRLVAACFRYDPLL